MSESGVIAEYRPTPWYVVVWLGIVGVQIWDYLTQPRRDSQLAQIAIVSGVLLVVLLVVGLPTRVTITPRGVAIRFSLIRIFVPIANASLVVVQKRLSFRTAYLVRRDGVRIRLPAVRVPGARRVNLQDLADHMNETLARARS